MGIIVAPEEEKGDDAEEGNKAAEGANSPDEQDEVLGELIDEAEVAAAPTMGGPSEAEVDSMLKGLLGSEEAWMTSHHLPPVSRRATIIKQ
jgi:hypothetical protein